MNLRPRSRSLRLLAVALLPLVGLIAACGSNTPSPSGTGDGPASSIRLGYFPNITHATALVGVQQGFFANELDKHNTKLQTQTFNDGPTEMQALKSGSLDAAFVGPSPAINAFSTTQGQALRIVAGAASGGAELVVKPSIASVADLKGKTIDTPQAGNTQDVALKYFLSQNGFHVNPDGSGDVKVINLNNSNVLTAYQTGQIDGAWLPEPYASQLVVTGGAKVLKDERDLWPGGQFATTELVVSTSFLYAHPETVDDLLRGEITTNAWIQANPDQAKTAANTALGSLPGGKKLAANILDRAWSELSVTNDPLATTLQQEVSHAQTAQLLSGSTNVHGLLDLRELNKVLAASASPGASPPPPIPDAGLGNQSGN